MSILNTNNYIFQFKIKSQDVPYQLEISAAQDVTEENTVDEQVITIRKREDGVSLIRRVVEGQDPKFSLAGHGVLVGVDQEQLKKEGGMMLTVMQEQMEVSRCCQIEELL